VKRVDPWKLATFLGEGGNARVWASESKDSAVAVKILKRTRGEPYDRFWSEVAVLERLGRPDGCRAWLPGPDEENSDE
jgi:hypothetical protein